MDFEETLRRLLGEFERLKTRYALMGGFALGALGAPRATADIDFLINREDMDPIHQFLNSLGYKRLLHTENVSQYQAAQQTDWVPLDFIQAFRKLSLRMLDRAIEMPLFQKTKTVRVLRPEDVIGLKVQAMINDPARKPKEKVDIEVLLEACRGKLDWDRLREFYELFDLLKEFEPLKERFGNA